VANIPIAVQAEAQPTDRGVLCVPDVAANVGGVICASAECRGAVAVGRGASFQDMAARLRRFRVSAFPVVDDDGTVIGIWQLGRSGGWPEGVLA